MAILLVRASFDDAVVKPHPAPLPHEVGDIFEVRKNSHYVNSAAGYGWARDTRVGRTHGRWTTYQIHVPEIPDNRTDLMDRQELHDAPLWMLRIEHSERGRKPVPTTAWVRGCWLDIDALALRHKLYLEQTGGCWLTRWEVESVFNTMTESVNPDLSRHEDV